MRNPDAAWLVDHQATAIGAAYAAGAPVPAVYEQVTVDGRPGLVMERVDGPDLLTQMGRRPWRLVPIAHRLGEIHAELHEVVAPRELPDLRVSLQQRIESADALPGPLRSLALDVLRGLPDGDRLCHGDFHPGNLLMGARGPMVVDWTLAARGDPTADVARQPLMIRLGELPPGTPVVIRAGNRFGRGTFLRLYLRSYRRRRPIDDSTWTRWQVVQAAARFAEGIEGEFPVLLRFLESRASE